LSAGEQAPTRAALVAILGRPNTGKSTLLNRLVGEKLAITTPRPQTTRHRLLGALTSADEQLVFIDTPGIQARPGSALNRSMNRQAEQALAGVDGAVLVVEAGRWRAEDTSIAGQLAAGGVPVVIVLNKIDRLREKARLLPDMQTAAGVLPEAELIPVSALRREGLDVLLAVLRSWLRSGPFILPAEDLTDRDMRFLAAEAVREKLMLRLGRELPYRINTVCESFDEQGRVVHIAVSIWVERESQKAIVIGRGGRVLREAGASARREIERLLGRQVDLQTWVKVRAQWTEDPKALRQIGLE